MIWIFSYWLVNTKSNYRRVVANSLLAAVKMQDKYHALRSYMIVA